MFTESLQIENGIGGYQEGCSDYETCGLKKHGLSRDHCILQGRLSLKGITESGS